MIRRGRSLLAPALACLLASGARAEEAKPERPPEDSVQVRRHEGASSVEATLAGGIVAAAAPRRSGGGREILLLVAPPRKPSQDPPKAEAAEEEICAEKSRTVKEAPKQPMRLVRLDTTGVGALVTLRDDLPGDASQIATADLDGVGADEILIATPKGIGILRADDGGWTTQRAATEDPTGQAPRSLQPGKVRMGAGTPDAVLDMTLGALRAHAASQDGAWRTLFETDLPLTAKRTSWGLALSGLAAERLAAPDGLDMVVTAPQTQGPDRLRSIVVRPGAAEPDRRVECFAKLPGPEKVLESSHVLLDGRPALAVTTMPAGKLSIFGEKLLRVFFLESDRTRLGKPPVLAVESGANLWQETRLTAADVDGDGRQDIVLAYWKGLKDDTVVLDAYLRRADGTFERSARSTSFDVEEADRDVLGYGLDLDGTGLPDLLVIAGGKLELHAGAAAARGGRNLVEAKPRWVVPIPFEGGGQAVVTVSIGTEGGGIERHGSSSSAPRPIDLDGDGRMELLLVGASQAVVVLPSR